MPETAVNVLEVPEFIAVTVGIVVFLSGMQINKRFSFLRRYNIPEPVTGGLIGAAIALGAYLLSDLQISYKLDARDALAGGLRLLGRDRLPHHRRAGTDAVDQSSVYGHQSPVQSR